MMQTLSPETAKEERYPHTPDERQTVLEQMERILASQHFRQSKRYPVLLRYVIERTLDGHASELKERTLGVEVFQRDASYDTNEDPVVRITAGEVRKRIAQYYHDFGHQDEPRIDLPAGSYVPQFRFHSLEAVEHSQPLLRKPLVQETPVLDAVEAADEHSLAVGLVPATRRPRRVLWLAVCLSLAAIALSVWLLEHRRSTPLESVWSPYFTSVPVLVSIGEPNLAYNQAGEPKAETLSVRDHMRQVDFMAFSDVQALSRVTGLLDSRRHPYRLQPASATTYADLRQGPAVLIGGYDNPWTMRALAQLRFHFARTGNGGPLWIEDRNSPGSRKWVMDFNQQYAQLTEDYAIVARFMDSNTHQPVIVIAGIGENGTKAASELLTDPDSDALRSLMGSGIQPIHGNNWSGQNFEALLEAHVINGVSGPPQVIEKEVW